MPSLIVMRGSHRMGPYRKADLTGLIDAGILLPEDACAPEDRPSQIRPVSWWIASAGDAMSTSDYATSAPAPTPARENNATWQSDPLLGGRMPLGGDTAVSRGEPPRNPSPPREGLLYRGRPTLLAYTKSLLLIVTLAVGIFFIDDLGPFETDPGITKQIGLTILMLVLCLLSLQRYASLYLITDRRVELVKGLIAKSSREIRIQDIRAINVSRQGILGLFGIGTVEFASAGSDGVEVAFDKVWNAGKVKLLVRKLQESSE